MYDFRLGLWLWSKCSSFMGLLMNREDFIVVLWFSLLLRYDFCYFSIWCR